MSESGWLSSEAFTSACAALPLVSIDLFVTRSSGRGIELLLGRRKNPPAQGWWFTPGGRIRKNEPLADALGRIACEEIGIMPGLLDGAELLGAWDHFYPDSAFAPTVSTHYVNLAYLLRVGVPVLGPLRHVQKAGAQHDLWRWIPLGEAAVDSAVHENVRVVVRELAGRGSTCQESV